MNDIGYPISGCPYGPAVSPLSPPSAVGSRRQPSAAAGRLLVHEAVGRFFDVVLAERGLCEHVSADDGRRDDGVGPRAP